MIYYTIEPPSVGLDEDIDSNGMTTMPFETWLGDDIVVGFQTFACTCTAKHAIDSASPTGITFKDLKTIETDTYRGYHSESLPKFYQMNIHGNEHYDDFWINSKHLLCISNKVYQELVKCKLQNCRIIIKTFADTF